MIIDLEAQAQNEKYYKSLRYLSHSLKGERRSDFINLLSEYNPYLAAQCAMSCERDMELENQLAFKAIEDSKSEIHEKKFLGILGLIELNRYDMISEVFSDLNNNIKVYRLLVKQIINELDTDNIIKFLKMIVDTNTKWLISSVINAVYFREISITNDQTKQVELIYENLKRIYSNGDYRILKFLLAFNLPKRLLPANLEIIAKKNIRRNRLELIKDLYNKYDIELPFSDYDICAICLSRNRQSTAFTFAKSFFSINENEEQLDLLRVCLKKGKYYSAFCLSLLKDKTKRGLYAYKLDNYLDILNQSRVFDKKNYPEMNQKIIEQLIINELK